MTSFFGRLAALALLIATLAVPASATAAATAAGQTLLLRDPTASDEATTLRSRASVARSALSPHPDPASVKATQPGEGHQ